MINSIAIKNVASYDDTGINLSDLKKINFFFGFNGSGKSTIAKFLHNLSLSPDQFSSDYSSCTQNGYNSTNHYILTFDEKFTEENFINNENLKGVFSLNQANELIDTKISEEELKIENINNRLFEKKELIKRLAEDKVNKEEELLDICWSSRSTFNTFTKLVLPHSRSRPNHLREIRSKLHSLPSEIVSLQDLKRKYDLLYESDLKEVDKSIDVNSYFKIRRIEVKLQTLLQEVIIGNEDVNIAELINQLNNRSWVETGVGLLSKTDTTCPFCQQNTITEELKKEFESFFDQSYKLKIDNIKILQEEYIKLYESLLSNLLEIQNEFNPNNLLSNVYLALQSLFNENKLAISEKLSKSNERQSIQSIVKEKVNLSKISKEIKENNNIFSEIDKNKELLLSDIWIYIASECKNKIDEFDKREIKYSRISSIADILVDKLNNDIVSSKQEIERLRSETINTQEAVENINIILKNAGFESFEIAEKSIVNNISQYYLKRPLQSNEESIFKSLSEGEKNFISFLYFYQLCIGTDNIQTNGSKKKIIVIDDPVSSLDNQALFVVSTLIHNLIARKGNANRPERQAFKNENIAQLFILTHNLYFYKEVSFNKRPICTDYWHYNITKINNKSKIKGDYNKTVHDDYSLLWNTIKELKQNLPQNKNLNIVIANSMRRIIESYVSFIGYGNDSWSSLLELDENDSTYYIKCAFISIINDESHKTSPMDGIYYQKLTNEQPQVLFDVFKEIFRSIGKHHYEMMLNEEIV
ncbi:MULTISPECIES: AAA family ATPase [unclassified Flavobacterium]|uniref:AAA family ATPase n=1 Tax=unclassified Flavobacterium TaxID=196869 RepID=UPI0013D79A42|nr:MULTISPECIES: AAA family ATPase [unclassified Flavobacterium]MBA5793915.1 AAA family ATPase [Flavobacterium sp. xlx-221]